MSVEEDVAELHGLVVTLFDYCNTLRSDINDLLLQVLDLQTRAPVVEQKQPQILDSYKRLIEKIGAKTMDRISLAYVLAPISEPGELPSVSSASDGLLGLEASEALRSVRPEGAGEAVTIGGGSKGTTTPSPIPVDDSNIGTPPDLDKVIWLGVSVATWPEVVSLKASIDTTAIRLTYSTTWVAQQVGFDKILGTFWIFVARGSNWYAAPILDLLEGQVAVQRSEVNGQSVDIPPIDSAWRPAPGVRYWVMISGIARGPVRNAQERSNLVQIVW